MKILLVDTATPLLVLGIKSAAGLEVLIEDNGMNHASLLAPRIQFLGEKCGILLKDLTGIGVVTGPGSFTGLRIGLSTAKGLAEALNIPLMGINGLDALGKTLETSDLPVAAVLDAKKNRMYGGIYLHGQRQGGIFDLSAQDFFQKFHQVKMLITGPDARSLFSEDFISPSWTWQDCRDWTPGLGALAQEYLKTGRLMAPGEGPYYHRTGEEDLGISLRNPKQEAPQGPGLLPGSA